MEVISDIPRYQSLTKNGMPRYEVEFTKECRKMLAICATKVFVETDERKGGECLLLITHVTGIFHNDQITLRSILA
jgi:hypothetical protein